MVRLPIGLRGTFTAKAPFTPEFFQDVIYEVESIRSIAEIAAAGQDAYELYYKQYSVSAESYISDAKNNVHIVAFKSSNGIRAYVPDNYLQDGPVVSGVVYQHLVLAIDIGPIPQTLNLAALGNKLLQVTQDTIGVAGNIKQIATSPKTLVAHETHTTNEATRTALVTNPTSNMSRVEQLLTENESLRTKIGLLEEYIRTKSI